MNRLLLLLIVAVVAGALAGLLAPGRTQAIIGNYSLRANPGATNTLNCGWHTGGCPSNPGGVALDWANSANAAVYWRSWGWCSIACGTIARGTISKTTPFCTHTQVAITDSAGRAQGTMVYVHTDTSQSGQTFNIAGAKDTDKYTSTGIGWSLAQERPACNGYPNFSGPHLHEQHSGTGWTKNTLYPNAPATGSYSVTALANYQVRRGWTLLL